MGEFTKGPWFVVETDGTDFTAISSSSGEVLGASEWLRCSDDDLLIMAAAPDLLEALEMAEAKLCMAEHMLDLREDDSPSFEHEILAARAAIARARGEA